MLKHKGEDANFRGYAYSNFLGSGVEAYQKALKTRGIESAVFSGKLKDADRKAMIEDYNSGKTPVMLISGAGAEGLDLKGTKLIQVLEPHWTNARIHQVRGRGIRYKSHAHLPEEERHTHVQHYFSQRPHTGFQKVLGLKKHLSADEQLHNIAAEKDRLNKGFLDALQNHHKSEPGKVANAKAEVFKNNGQQ